jgi:ParB-like chromosome segregation protein Spo0J
LNQPGYERRLLIKGGGANSKEGRIDSMAALSVVYFEPKDLKPYPRNARRHSNKQIRQIAGSIRTFGFTNPILIDAHNMILAGHGRVEAAKILNMATVPCVRIETVTPDQRRAYVLADNKLALNAGWDQEILAIELQGLVDLGFDMTVTGFSLAEADFILDAARDGATDTPAGPEDVIPLMSEDAVTRMGDLWRSHLYRSTLQCSDRRTRLRLGTNPASRVRYGRWRNVTVELHRFLVRDIGSGGQAVSRRGNRLRLHGLATYERAADGGPSSVFGA